MSLLTKEKLEEFLRTADLKYKPRQSKLSLPIMQRIYHKMTLGVLFRDILTAGDLIVEGHHRYICSEIAKKELGVTSWTKTDGSMELEWINVVIDEIDYDSPDLIREHNRRDAERSGLNIENFNTPVNE